MRWQNFTAKCVVPLLFRSIHQRILNTHEWKLTSLHRAWIVKLKTVSFSSFYLLLIPCGVYRVEMRRSNSNHSNFMRFIEHTQTKRWRTEVSKGPLSHCDRTLLQKSQSESDKYTRILYITKNKKSADFNKAPSQFIVNLKACVISDGHTAIWIWMSCNWPRDTIGE